MLSVLAGWLVAAPVGAALAPAGGMLLAQADAVEAEGTIDADAAARIVQDHTGGRVLKVERVAPGGPAEFAVKILQEDGMVKTIRLDASGQLLDD